MQGKVEEQIDTGTQDTGANDPTIERIITPRLALTTAELRDIHR